MPTIFFSWQSDTDEKTGRYFLRDTLQLALKDVAADTSVEEAHRSLDLDHDTKGVPGSPSIATTIYRKIRECTLFVADMTYVGARDNGTRMPNPNVLIEHGVALEARGEDFVIKVMNTAFGSPKEHPLPFDLAHVRWPIAYRLELGADKATIQKVQQELAKVLAGAIRDALGAVPVPPPSFPPVFSRAPQVDGQFNFRDNSLVTLGRDWSPIPYLGGSGDKKVLLAEGPAIWVRLIPGSASDKTWSPDQLFRWATHGGLQLDPLLQVERLSPRYLIAGDGFGCWLGHPRGTSNPEDKIVEAGSVAFAFETGEVWAVDTFMLSVQGRVFALQDVIDRMVFGLKRYSTFLRNLGFTEPFVWKAGITGAQDFSVFAPVNPNSSGGGGRSPQYHCNSPDIKDEGTLQAGQSVHEAIRPFIELACRRCGFSRPDFM